MATRIFTIDGFFKDLINTSNSITYYTNEPVYDNIKNTKKQAHSIAIVNNIFKFATIICCECDHIENIKFVAYWHRGKCKKMRSKRLMSLLR